MPWKKTRDPLFRGDDAAGVVVPDPSAPTSIVEHILYLGGAGRPTSYHSTSESEDTAAYFAGRTGKVYRTSAGRVSSHGVAHVSQVELLQLLRGKGKGKAKSHSALLVMQARRLVEQWGEHLLDFTGVDSSTISDTARKIYEP